MEATEFLTTRSSDSTRFVRILGPYRVLWYGLVLGLLLLSAARLAMMVWQWPRVVASGLGWAQLLGQGIRVDLIQLGILLALPVILLPFFAAFRAPRAWFRFCLAWTVACLLLLLFMELATPSFILQFDLRPNRLFVEYLIYPQQVLAMLWNGYRGLLIGSVLLLVISAWLLWRFLQAAARRAPFWTLPKVLWSWPLVLLMLAAAIRSTTDHRPANPAMFALSSDGLVNALILNSTWSVLHSMYAMRHETDTAALYGAMEPEQMLRIVRESAGWSAQAFGNAQFPTLHLQEPAITRLRPLNLVIVLEESMGATFVESLGGLPVTPRLEQLKQRGWWFERMYATGTRSARGIEAVVAGFMPTPARAVLKLSLAQSGFFTLGQLLGRQGYHTEFMYGGEAHFDNMRGFLGANGFDHMLDRADFANPQFVGSWGVSDGDLFKQAHARLETLHAQQKPFFAFIFSSSNHEPFEFPDGVIASVGPRKQTVENAVRYADAALGEFFNQAQASAYWSDTLFLVVADHDNRVYGDNLVPVHKFHIPALLLGADLQPRVVRTLASQIDLAPTLLSLMGIRAEHPMLGRDLAQPDLGPGRAMLQFDRYFAWMEQAADAGPDHVTILRPEQSPLAGEFDQRSGQLKLHSAAPSVEQSERALAHVNLAAWLYRERRYGLPDDPVVKQAAGSN